MENKKPLKFILQGKGIITREELDKIMKTEDEKSEQKQYDILPEEEYIKTMPSVGRKLLLARNKAVEKFLLLACPYNEVYLKKRIHTYFNISNRMLNDLVDYLVHKGALRRTSKGRLERIE